MTEQRLREIESLTGQAAGTEWVSELERKGMAVPELIATIREQRRRIEELEGAARHFDAACGTTQ